jgi:hypothetical protein
MGAPKIGVIHNEYFAFLPVARRDQRLHGIGHTAKVNGDVRGLRSKRAVRGEQCAGKIEPVFDVWRECRSPKYTAHLIANRLQAARE